MTSETDNTRCNDLADAIAGARAAGELLDHRHVHELPRTVDAACHVQDRTIAQQPAAPRAWKLGATTKAVQCLLGLAEPSSGPVLPDVMVPSPARIDATRYSCHVFEPEIAIRLARDIDGPLDRDAAREAIATFHPAIEVINFRFRDGRSMDALGMISDFGANGGLVLGAAAPDGAYDYTALALDLRVDGHSVAQRAAMPPESDPIALLAWFSQHLTARRHVLRAGDVITTGSQAGVIPYTIGSQIEADFGPVGRTVVQF